MSGVAFSVPRELRRGNLKYRELEFIAQGEALLRLLAEELGLPDLAGRSVLDMGCGSKLVEAILRYNLPVGRYVGVDVSRELIDYLQDTVRDPRFHFQYLNAHNQMYNPGGAPLDARTRLLLDEHSFDVVCLFSVFIHLAPHDYVAMLRMLRRYIKPRGRLIFSLLLNETSAGGHAFWDGLTREWSAAQREVLERRGAVVESFEGLEPPDFLDWDPVQPLKWAIYSRAHALRLIEGTGWTVESVNEPRDFIQHYIVCRPA